MPTWILTLLLAVPQDPPPPVALDGRLTVELVAQEPEIANPTGIAVDARGRIWVVENNTHMRTKDYPGPATDRLRVFEEFGSDGRARKSTTVADGFVLGMNLAIGHNGEVYLITRNSIELVGETRRPIVRLETVGDYHHNGLFGMAVDDRGDLYFALGRNTGKEFPLGAPWTLVGTDGSKISGTEGGRIFRCRADGSALAPVAGGFWNTFNMTFDGLGRLFAIDNDPGGGSECRLLHVVAGGDYGFRPRAGYRDGHPFISWNGEHPGTLPMVSFTGEAPAGILSCESDLWPEEYRGALLVTSWGDHQVERYRLERKGASFTARGEAILRGNDAFRPVGIAPAPDGSICISDWVDRSYPVHGKGRIWRIRLKEPQASAASDLRARVKAVRAAPETGLADPAEDVRGEAVRGLPEDDPRRLQIATSDASKYVRLQALLGLKPPSPLPNVLFELLGDVDPFLVGAAISVLGRSGATEELCKRASSENPKIRVGVLTALRRTGMPVDRAVIQAFLRDAEPSIRRAAIQWAAEDGLTELSVDISGAASRLPITLDVFEAYLGALEFFSPPVGGKRDGKMAEGQLVRILMDAGRPGPLRAYALRMVRPDHPALTLDLFRDWLVTRDDSLRLEAVRSLSRSREEPAQAMLRLVAGDQGLPSALRLEATAGLGQSAAASEPTRRLLVSLFNEENEDLKVEAVRSVGGAVSDPAVRRALHELQKSARDRGLASRVALTLKLGGESTSAPQPKTLDEWRFAGTEIGDAAAGERIFFHPRGPQCFACHRIRGRGGEVGPDLSRVGRGVLRDRLIDSILEPSRDIAPDFAAWEFITREGDSWIGRILRDEIKSVTLLGPSGRPVTLDRAEIAARRPSRVSMMPDGLQLGLTEVEFRDLVTFLASLK